MVQVSRWLGFGGGKVGAGRKVPLLVLTLLFGLLQVFQAHAAITANVTFLSDEGYRARNNAYPAEIMFYRSSIPNAGNNYEEVANNNSARLTINGNVTNATVNLGSTGGYFTSNFINSNYSSGTGCTVSPITFFESRQLNDGETINITITCTVPDTTPPTLLSASTSVDGTKISMTWSEVWTAQSFIDTHRPLCA